MEQLHEVVLKMRKQVDQMSDILRKNGEQIVWLVENQDDGSDLPNEKPPHY